MRAFAGGSLCVCVSRTMATLSGRANLTNESGKKQLSCDYEHLRAHYTLLSWPDAGGHASTRSGGM